jgi:F0F1-type ATP synthase assembly protein I
MSQYLKYINLGIMLVLPAVICVFIGAFLDGLFGTGHVMTLIFLILGIITGFFSTYKTLKTLEQEK